MGLAPLQNVTDWTPTPNQARLLDAAVECGLGRSITDICKRAGVSRPVFYRAMEKPEFKAAWGATWQEAIKHHLPGIVAAQVHQALEGETPAARLLLEAAGVLKQGDGGGSGPVVIRNYIGVTIERGD